jgi:hypothetical protein
MTILRVNIILYFLIEVSFTQTNNCISETNYYTESLKKLQEERDSFKILFDQNQKSISSFEIKLADQAALLKEQAALLKEQAALLKEQAALISELKTSNDLLKTQFNDFQKQSTDKFYMFKESIIYQNIIDAYDKGVISKMGSPSGWDDTTHRVTEWNQRKMLKIGLNPQNTGNGAKVLVPQGYNVMWLRVTNDIYNVFRIASLDFPNDETQKYACFGRFSNEISPDGGTTDSNWNFHKWCPFPLHRTGNYVIYTDRDTHGWISGLGFSKNLHNMAKNGGLAYTWAINGGTALPWHSNNWNNDVLCYIPQKVISILKVPVVPSGKDKLLFIIQHNDTFDGLLHTSVAVNNTPVERLRTGFINPFSTHANSKIYQRYAATIIPKELIASEAKFLTVTIDMTYQNESIYFREIGTHDFIN